MPACFDRSHAGAEVVLDVQLKVALQLLGQLALSACLAKQAAHS
jgi:hypothetical protein